MFSNWPIKSIHSYRLIETLVFILQREKLWYRSHLRKKGELHLDDESQKADYFPLGKSQLSFTVRGEEGTVCPQLQSCMQASTRSLFLYILVCVCVALAVSG